MMKSTIENLDKMLIAPVPKETKTYKPVSHKQLIDLNT